MAFNKIIYMDPVHNNSYKRSIFLTHLTLVFHFFAPLKTVFTFLGGREIEN